MPVALSYPGVYIEEVPSGLRAISGVATSITGFVGTALRGPVGQPIRVQGRSEYERRFGRLSRLHPMSYAVAHFFQNGGGDAIIVRVSDAGTDASSEAAVDTLPLEAAAPGLWGDELRARIDHATRPEVGTEELFNLAVRDGATGTIERFLNVSVLEDHPRFIGQVLAQGSELVRLAAAGAPAARPGANTGDADDFTDDAAWTPFASGGAGDPPDAAAVEAGLEALRPVDLFNLLVVPPVPTAVPGEWEDLADTTVARALEVATAKRALYIQDPPADWTTVGAAVTGAATLTRSPNAALYWPRILAPDPEAEGRLRPFAPSGVIAGLMARTDAARGVWKAPAGIEATLIGAPGLEVVLTDGQNGLLNPLGINCLRAFPNIGRVAWGSRTLAGADVLASEWKYVPVRRLALFLQESLYRGTQWVVFEPNDEPLWGQIRMVLGGFMQGLFRQGAFAGSSPRDAYFVKCDRETTTQADILNGIVNIRVGFAPLRPAEFVVIQLQQMAGQSDA